MVCFMIDAVVSTLMDKSNQIRGISRQNARIREKSRALTTHVYLQFSSTLQDHHDVELEVTVAVITSNLDALV